MRGKFFKGVVVGAVMSGLTLASTAAFAGNGIGGIFSLGRTNTVNATSVLQGSTNGPQLRVTNSSTGPAASGIDIRTNSSRPPLAVNSQAKVNNLNGDLLDGIDSLALQKRVAGFCANGTAISSVDSTGSVSCAKSAQFPIHAVIATGGFANNFLESSLNLQFQCRLDGSGFVGPIFVNEGGTDTSLNWMFSEGGTTSTVNAEGQTVASGKFMGFSLPGPRLEGQFIWSDAKFVVTVHLHVVDDPAECEFSGTALVASTS